MSDQIVKPGAETSEFAAMRSASQWGRALVAVGLVVGVASPYIDVLAAQYGHLKWVSAALISFGLLKELLIKLKYIGGRNALKAEAIAANGVTEAAPATLADVLSGIVNALPDILKTIPPEKLAALFNGAKQSPIESQPEAVQPATVAVQPVGSVIPPAAALLLAGLLLGSTGCASAFHWKPGADPFYNYNGIGLKNDALSCGSTLASTALAQLENDVVLVLSGDNYQLALAEVGAQLVAQGVGDAKNAVLCLVAAVVHNFSKPGPSVAVLAPAVTNGRVMASSLVDLRAQIVTNGTAHLKANGWPHHFETDPFVPQLPTARAVPAAQK